MKCITVSPLFVSLMITLATSLTVNREGGYENIVVAISSSVQKHRADELITKIQVLLDDTSNRLYTATRGTFYFKSATISVPSDWDTITVKPAQNSYNLYSEADVKILNPNIGIGDQPFIATERQNECGAPGKYIQIDTKFFDDGLISSKERDYKLLQNWAALRYGVFEEKGFKDSKVFPLMYEAEDGWKMTSCEHPYYWLYNAKSDCKENQVSDIPCQFEKKINSIVNSSIMSGDGRAPMAQSFCSSDETSKHNTEAPTPQNAFCQHKSTWEVITSSIDFKNITMPNTNAQAPPVDLNVVRRNPIKTVIIIDPKLCQAPQFKIVVPSIINELLDNPNIDITLMISQSKIPRAEEDFISSTCQPMLSQTWNFEDALMKGAEEITKDGETAAIGNIIYVTNGKNNDDVPLTNFLDLYANIHLNVVNYPPRQEKASSLFQQTRPHLFLHNIPIGDNQQNDCDLRARIRFDEVFDSIFQYYTDASTPYKLLISKPIFDQKTPFKGILKFPFNADITVTAYFCENPTGFPTLTWNNSPNSYQLTRGSNAKIAKNRTPILYRPGTSLQGTEYSFVSGFTNPSAYALTFWMKNINQNAIEFEGSTLPDSGNPAQNNSMPPRLKVVTNLNNPIVTAVITDLSNMKVYSTETLRKLPKEEKSSLHKDTYFKYVVDFAPQPSTYSVVFTATDETNSYMINSLATFSSKFTSNGIYKFPPQRILDFSVNNTDSDMKTVMFTWTAPGAQFDRGTTIAYYLQCRPTVNKLRDIKDYAKLKISPNVTGTQEFYEFKDAAESYDAHFCTLIAEGAPGMYSEPSNTAVFYMHTETSETASVGTAVGIAIGVVALVVIVAVASFYAVRYRKKRQQRQDNFSSAKDTRVQIDKPDIVLRPLPTNDSPESEKLKPEEVKSSGNGNSSTQPLCPPREDSRPVGQPEKYHEEVSPYAVTPAPIVPEERDFPSDDYEKDPYAKEQEKMISKYSPGSKHSGNENVDYGRIEKSASQDSSPKQQKNLKGSHESVV